MIRLLFVDDHPVVAESLAARYRQLPGWSVAGVAASMAEAFEVVRVGSVDVAVVDIQLEAVVTPRQVTELSRHTRVMLFSARAGDSYVKHLLAAGARGVLDKAAPLERLDALVRQVAAAAPVRDPAQPETRRLGARERLSEREYLVYRELARCLTPKEVSAALRIARSTVYCHIESIRRKLNVQTLQEIVARSTLDD